MGKELSGTAGLAGLIEYQAGTIVSRMLLPANEPHALKATKRFKMVLTMIKGELS